MLGEATPARRKARKACATSRLPFSWLRFDVCSEPRKVKELPPVSNSRAVSRILHDAIPFAGRGREHLLVLCLDNKNVPLAVANPHVGGRSSAAVDPVSVLRPAVLVNASSIILAHTHPSNVSGPSPEDDQLTQRLKKAGKVVGVPLYDHVILTDNPEVYFSYADQGRMPEG